MFVVFIFKLGKDFWKDSLDKIVVKYVVYVYGVFLVIVLLNIVIFFIIIFGRDIGYDKIFILFIYKIVYIVIFIVFLVYVCVINMIFYIVIIYKIKLCLYVDNILGNRVYFVVYIKLFLFIGFIWIL